MSCPRLEQQQVGAAFDQTPRLLIEKIREFVKADIAELGIIAGGQHAAGSHAASHEAGDAGFGFAAVAGGAGDTGGRPIDLQRALAQAMLGQRAAIAAESVGLDCFGAGIQEGFVNLADDIRARDDEIIDAILISGAAEVVFVEIVALDAGAHSAIEDDDVVVDGLKIAPVAENLRFVFHSVYDSR